MDWVSVRGTSISIPRLSSVLHEDSRAAARPDCIHKDRARPDPRAPSIRGWSLPRDWPAQSRPGADAPEQIPQENDLHGGQAECRPGDPALQRHGLREEIEGREVRIAARVAGETGEMHGQKCAVSPDERQVEVQLAEALVQHAAEHQRKPVERAGEYAEQRRDAHHQVKVRHHEIRVVKIGVELRLAEKQSGQAAGDEDRDESERRTAWRW